MSILVTGGAGYIGSHTTIELLEAGYEVVVIDDFSNSHPTVIDRIKTISQKAFSFYEFNLLDEARLIEVFDHHQIEAVIHFAAFKAVGESVDHPIAYYHNNLTTTLLLLKVMKKFEVKNFIFSSSATVYGEDNPVPFTETMPVSEASNPYGQSKLMVERILQDVYRSDPEWSVTLLRYFNPIGAHPSALIGEDPSGVPNNLVPYLTQVAVGQLDHLQVFGDDYPTHDGTGVRDYIHVVDLAKGHLKALAKKGQAGLHIYNLGTGRGYSVLDLIKAFESVNGIKISYRIVDRRPGDVAVSFANPDKAFQELNWQAAYDLEDMVRDSWRWQKNNPKGYE